MKGGRGKPSPPAQGISNRPPAEEEARQDRLPPRGRAREQDPASPPAAGRTRRDAGTPRA